MVTHLYRTDFRRLDLTTRPPKHISSTGLSRRCSVSSLSCIVSSVSLFRDAIRNAFNCMKMVHTWRSYHTVWRCTVPWFRVLFDFHRLLSLPITVMTWILLVQSHGSGFPWATTQEHASLRSIRRSTSLVLSMLCSCSSGCQYRSLLYSHLAVEPCLREHDLRPLGNSATGASWNVHPFFPMTFDWNLCLGQSNHCAYELDHSECSPHHSRTQRL